MRSWPSACCFAFSTIVGWNLFGRINVDYLFGKKANLAYSIIAIIFIFLGSCLSNDLVWELTDMFNQLMVLPNMIALVALSGIVAVAARKYNDEHELRTEQTALHRSVQGSFLFCLLQRRSTSSVWRQTTLHGGDVHPLTAGVDLRRVGAEDTQSSPAAFRRTVRTRHLRGWLSTFGSRPYCSRKTATMRSRRGRVLRYSHAG